MVFVLFFTCVLGESFAAFGREVLMGFRGYSHIYFVGKLIGLGVSVCRESEGEGGTL